MPRRQTETYISPFTHQECMVCSRCGEEKDLTNFYELRGKHKSGVGYQTWCKQCVAEYRKSREDDRVVVNPRNGLHEILCGHCKEQKSTSEFYRENYVFSKLCKKCTRTSRIAAE